MKDLSKGTTPYQKLFLVGFLHFFFDFLGRFLAKRCALVFQAYDNYVFPPFIIISNPPLKLHPARL